MFRFWTTIIRSMMPQANYHEIIEKFFWLSIKLHNVILCVCVTTICDTESVVIESRLRTTCTLWRWVHSLLLFCSIFTFSSLELFRMILTLESQVRGRLFSICSLLTVVLFVRDSGYFGLKDLNFCFKVLSTSTHIRCLDLQSRWDQFSIWRFLNFYVTEYIVLRRS
jgi:hypothetical protein